MRGSDLGTEFGLDQVHWSGNQSGSRVSVWSDPVKQGLNPGVTTFVRDRKVSSGGR